VTLRFATTPLAPVTDFPSPRENGFDPVLADALVPSPAREAALERLHQADAFVLTSGQQPGLFTGPLYTVYKALSTAGLARVLERQWQRPVVPMFWIAGDDHDFAEASRASWITADGTVRTAQLSPRANDAPLTPMYRELLGSGITTLLDQLASDLPVSEFREATLEWLGRHYRPDATIAGSFAGALAELLAPAGVVCLESTHPAAKRAAAGYLVRALGLARELNRDLSRHAEDLQSAGLELTVTLDEQATLVMVEGALGRDRLLVDAGGFITRRSRERFTLDALAALAAAQPERLSPNVLLRPVIESALLPTVAYLAGPGELSYLPLTRPIYERMRVPRQAVLPRWSGVLVEPRVDRVLRKFDIDLMDLLQPPGALEARLVRSQLPDQASRALDSLRQALASGYDELARSAGDIDPTLTRPVQGAKHQAVSSLQDIERKLIQHLKRRQETELGQLAKARTLVHPESQPQERLLTVAPFLARYGPSLITELLETIEGWYASALEGALHPS
jgi:bacillithiol biosynthesis cysteine-adding enzyme BshC